MSNKGMEVSQIVALIIFVALLVVLLIVITGSGEILNSFADRFEVGSFKDLFS